MTRNKELLNWLAVAAPLSSAAAQFLREHATNYVARQPPEGLRYAVTDVTRELVDAGLMAASDFYVDSTNRETCWLKLTAKGRKYLKEE